MDTISNVAMLEKYILLCWAAAVALGRSGLLAARRSHRAMPGGLPLQLLVAAVADQPTLLPADPSIRCQDAVSQEQLLGWQAALFPLDRSSYSVGRQRVHFEALSAARLAVEMH